MYSNLRDDTAIVLVSLIGGIVRYTQTCQKEKFSLTQLVIGLASSGLIGYVSYGVCDAFGLSAITTSSVAAMAGYGGSGLLDAVHGGILNTIETFFKTIVRRIGKGEDNGHWNDYRGTE